MVWNWTGGKKTIYAHPSVDKTGSTEISLKFLISYVPPLWIGEILAVTKSKGMSDVVRERL